ncbi:hypothetical protein B0H13DRAFT_1888711 [Mycena leptocephala]|nr:hypothetical protein B0H13DRAFT_1888711 [Mycena leptocephala]
MATPSHAYPIPSFACCYNDQRNLLASGGANGFFSIQMILAEHGVHYHITILKAQLSQPVSAPAWIASTAFPPCGMLVIGLKNGLVQRLNFSLDICTKTICHNFIPMRYCLSAVLSLAYGLDGLLVISASGQYFFMDIGQTIRNDTPRGTPIGKRDEGDAQECSGSLHPTPSKGNSTNFKSKAFNCTPASETVPIVPITPLAHRRGARGALPGRATDGTWPSFQRTEGFLSQTE